jgi:crotonobetainyl-CoA:carnitine CoA-transferase CaiB-like acyl-CoA transferase
MDITIQAISGVVHTTGFPDEPPVKAGPAIIDFVGGIHLASGVLGALFKRERTSEGEYVDVSMFDCTYPMLMSPLAKWISGMDVPPRTGNQHSGLSIAPYNIYEVTDGYVAIACITEPQWRRLTQLMDEEWMLEEPQFDSKVSRAAHYEEIDSVVESWLNDKSKDEAVELLIDQQISCAPVQTLEELVEDPQLEHRQMINYFENKESRGWDEIPVPGMPVKLDSTDDPEIWPSPGVGEHTEEVLAEYLAYESDRIDDLRSGQVIE